MLKNVSRARIRRLILTYLMLTIGAFIASLAVMVFLAPNSIAPGGVTGIAIISNKLLSTPIGLLIFLLNIPIQLVALRLLPGGWRNVLRAAYVILLFTVFIDWLTPYIPLMVDQESPLLNALFGAILSGIGSGIVIRAGGNFGGTSTIALIIHRRTGMPLSSIYLYTDTLIILAAAYFLNLNAAMLALVTLFIDGVAANYVIEGPSVIRTALIITNKPEAISQAVMMRLDRGVTAWEARGMYTQQPRTVLYISISRSQVEAIQRLVHRIDPDAFLVIGQGHTAYGQGFKRRMTPMFDITGEMNAIPDPTPTSD